jgi:hypothetical protein
MTLSTSHRNDRRRYITDLEYGKVGLSWEPFCLVFAATGPDKLEQAIEEIRPFGAGRSAGLVQSRQRAELFARRLGAAQPAMLIDLLEALCDASDVDQGRIVGHLMPLIEPLSAQL